MLERLRTHVHEAILSPIRYVPELLCFIFVMNVAALASRTCLPVLVRIGTLCPPLVDHPHRSTQSRFKYLYLPAMTKTRLLRSTHRPLDVTWECGRQLLTYDRLLSHRPFLGPEQLEEIIKNLCGFSSAKTLWLKTKNLPESVGSYHWDPGGSFSRYERAPTDAVSRYSAGEQLPPRFLLLPGLGMHSRPGSAHPVQSRSVSRANKTTDPSAVLFFRLASRRTLDQAQQILFSRDRFRQA
jgi:hypothetical protein